MRPITAALLASTVFTPTAFAAPMDLIATFDVAGFTFAPEETQQQSLEWTGDPNPFTNDFSGGYLSPQTGTGPENTDYIDSAAEEELRNGIFNPAYSYGGAEWNGANNSGATVPIYQGDSYAGLSGAEFDDAFSNTWLLPEDKWEFNKITSRFVLDSNAFTAAALGAAPNTDIVTDGFSLLDADLNPLFFSDTLGSVFSTNAGDLVTQQVTAAVALNSSGLRDENGNLIQENDILVIAAIDNSVPGPEDFGVGLYAVAFFGDENWFETAFETNGEENLLATLTDPSYGLGAQFLYEERLWGGTAGDFTPHGTLRIQGTLDTLVTETSGSSEASALLPGAPVGEGGGFGFEVDIAQLTNESGILWIDPIIATGYTYKATRTIEGDNGPEVENVGFTAVQAPGLAFVNDPDGYTLTVTHIIDAQGNLVELDEADRPSYGILPGQIVSFATDIPEGASTAFLGRVGIFELTGISEALMLDPENGLVFQTGLGFDQTTGLLNITQTPILTEIHDVDMAPVPLPLPALMLLSGLGGLALMRRRKASA